MNNLIRIHRTAHSVPVHRSGILLACTVILLFSSAAYAHLELTRTAPVADSVNVSRTLSEIRLWFSEAPQISGTTVRLANAAGGLVATTAAAADPEDPKQVFIRPEAPLAPGGYTINWRSIAQDGHAMNGSFSFRVRE